MPNFEAHRKIGFLFSVIFSVVIFILMDEVPIDGWKIWLVFPVILFYSNLPDLDHHMGRLRKRVYFFVFLCMILATFIVIFINIWILLLFLLTAGAMGVLTLSVKHRGPFHTYWFVFLSALPLLWVHWFLAMIGFVAATSHIFIDRLWSRTKRKVRKVTGTQNKTYKIIFKW